MAPGGKIIAPHGVCVYLCVCVYVRVVCVCVCLSVYVCMRSYSHALYEREYQNVIYVCWYMHVQYSHACTMYAQLLGTPLGDFQ